VTLLVQLLDDLGADQAGSADDYDLHDVISRLIVFAAERRRSHHARASLPVLSDRSSRLLGTRVTMHALSPRRYRAGGRVALADC
jgi:hypothetical protein